MDNVPLIRQAGVPFNRIHRIISFSFFSALIIKNQSSIYVSLYMSPELEL